MEVDANKAIGTTNLVANGSIPEAEIMRIGLRIPYTAYKDCQEQHGGLFRLLH